jgi:hypothetical protein
MQVAIKKNKLKKKNSKNVVLYDLKLCKTNIFKNVSVSWNNECFTLNVSPHIWVLCIRASFIL